MFESETFGFAIARPLPEVYEFLLEPTNFARWAFVDNPPMQQIKGRDWAVETSVGPRIIRFADRNVFGVLDHEILRHETDLPHPTGMWVIENSAGTELIYTNFRRPGMTDSEWSSLKTWVTTDLLALQSLLEARGRVAPLFEAKAISFTIDRPLREAYDFLAEPRNFAKWAFVDDPQMTPIEDGQWAVETSVGSRVLRFATPHNRFGVVSYESRLSRETELHPVPMRVLPNGEGTELVFVFFRRPQNSPEEWASIIEWVTADLMVLKTLLETR